VSEIIYATDVRLSFPALVEPKVRVDAATGNKRSAYECDIILDESNPGWAQFMQRFAELAQIAGKEHAQALMQMIMNDPKSRCFGDGGQKLNKKTFQPWDGYAGKKFISMSAKQSYQLIGSDGKVIDPVNPMAWQAAARKLYGGCRVNVAMKPWWQNANPQKGYGHGIRCDLIAMQFLRDDTPFGDAAPDASNMFGAVAGAAPAAVPSFMDAPSAAPAMPAPPTFGAPQMPGLPAFMQR